MYNFARKKKRKLIGESFKKVSRYAREDFLYVVNDKITVEVSIYRDEMCLECLVRRNPLNAHRTP